jgi:murein DD-endopeptidase MepM/ murein hydrolase activator NlpD
MAYTQWLGNENRIRDNLTRICTIKYRTKHLGKIIIAASLLLLAGLSTLLIIEYRFFHDQAQKMLELKEEYRAYTLAVKKILNEYNALKEEAADTILPAASNDYNKEAFVPVNRDVAYLKQSTLDYIRKEKLGHILHKIDPDEWISNGTAKTTPQSKTKNKKTTTVTKRTTTAKKFAKFYKTDANFSKDITFCWPIDRSQFWLSSFFGPRKKPDHSWGFHFGIDMAAVKGTPIVAAADGLIVEAHFHPGYGNTILISHNNKYKTRYAHLDKMLVCVGQKVEKGTLIGKVGATGAVRKKKGRDASHLHFEVYAHGKQVNPLPYFT